MRSSTIYLGGKGEGKYRATHAYCAVINVPSRVELSRVELSRVELSRVELSRVELFFIDSSPGT